jgi:hypothetical protein
VAYSVLGQEKLAGASYVLKCSWGIAERAKGDFIVVDVSVLEKNGFPFFLRGAGAREEPFGGVFLANNGVFVVGVKFGMYHLFTVAVF